MGVYLNTFRTESKTALFNGQPVKVYAFRYLCKAQDVDGWNYPKRAALLRAQCEQAAKRFDAHKPAFAAVIHEKLWDGATVYANPKGACHYDTEGLTKEPIGFLRELPGKRAFDNGAKGWTIATERHGEDSPMYCGHTVRRAYVESYAGGVYSHKVKSYHFSNGATLTPEAFAEWKAKAEPEYMAYCQKRQDEETARQAEAARQVQAKRDAKNAEIQAARDTLARLERERTLIG